MTVLGEVDRQFNFVHGQAALEELRMCGEGGGAIAGYPALLVLALLVPMKLLGRWVYST